MRPICIFLLAILFGTTTLAQSTGANRTDAVPNDSTALKVIASKLNSYTSVHITEKVYLHLDKPAYAPGDTIWYKAYTVIGPRHQPSALSGVLYVELISPKDSVITRQVIKLNSGTAAAELPLPALAPQGIYRLRAYTTWMRNDGSAYFYDQPLLIGIPPDKSAAAAPKTYDVQFFPEGGTMVNGVRSRIAVKVIDANGLGADGGGTIEDNDGNAVTEFTTKHLGMGAFALTPESGKRYKAIMRIAGASPYNVDLPTAAEAGISLGINNSQPDSLYIKVATNEKTLSEHQASGFYLVAQSGGKIYYTSAGKLNGLVFTAGLDKKRFPTGIAQFTLFSQDGQPVAERIAFLETGDTLNLKLEAHLSTNSVGQKSNIDIKVKNSEGQPVAGNFSVSVINEDGLAFNEQAESTILDNLLLTSDLQGYIEKPNYYFSNRNNQTRADLDLLMLTQGYRRFEWKAVINDIVRSMPKWQAEKLPALSGNVKTLKGKPVANAKISLAAMREGLFIDTIADQNGNFRFTGLNLTDSARVLLRLAGDKIHDDVKISIDSADNAPVTGRNEIADTSGISPGKIQSLRKTYDDLQAEQALKNTKLLKEVNIRARRTDSNPDVPYSANLNGAGNADQVIKGDQLTGCINLVDCLNGKIYGVMFKGGIPVMMRTQRKAMVLIVDGSVESASHLSQINPEDINSIEVLKSGAYLAIYGFNASGGALVITMKKGTGSDAAIPSDIVNYQFKGFYAVRTFYVPKYAHTPTDRGVQHQNATIYWNANIGTDNDGKASIEYLNTGPKGNYRVVIEGIDDDGNLGRQVFRYKVE